MMKKYSKGLGSIIAEDAVIDCEEFSIGNCCYIGPGCEIHCRRFVADDYLYMEKDVEVGRGGCKGPNSTVTIGKSVFLGADVVINPSEPVVIGDFVGIGAEVGIWTHGAWPHPFMCGVQPIFAPVTIGPRVWLTGGSKVLPGVSIGHDSIVGMLSLVNKNVPPMTLAGGIPVKNIRPLRPIVDEDERIEVLRQIAERYAGRVKDLNLPVQLSILDGDTFELKTPNVHCIFNVDTLKVRIESAPLVATELDWWAEDFRDFLRRNGIRFLTGRPFKRISE